MREKWVPQDQHTIGELYAADIAWEDAKPENVLIDGNEDACGGFRESWEGPWRGIWLRLGK